MRRCRGESRAEEGWVLIWLAIAGKLDAGTDEGVVMVGDGIGNGMGLFFKNKWFLSKLNGKSSSYVFLSFFFFNLFVIFS